MSSQKYIINTFITSFFSFVFVFCIGAAASLANLHCPKQPELLIGIAVLIIANGLTLVWFYFEE